MNNEKYGHTKLQKKIIEYGLKGVLTIGKIVDLFGGNEKKAFEIAKTIYSIHKGGSDKFLLDLAKDNKFHAIKLAEFNFVIKKSMGFHDKAKYPVKVELWKFVKVNL